jgi:predicted MFS family arabinose efflux permease
VRESVKNTFSGPVAREDSACVHYTTLVLVLVAVFNLLDRQILAILIEPIKRDLQLSDTAIGVLTGFAFVAFYTLASVPIARLADHANRRTIIAVALAFWSVMTAVSSLASSFAQLALARIGVGIGESATAPASHSMLSDMYPTGRRALALSLIATASPLGMMVAFIGGGWLNDAVGWRMTLVCAGVPGLVLALVVWLTVREPERGASEERAADTTHYGFGVTLRYLVRSRAFVWLTVGAALANFTIVGVIVWSSSFLVRVHDMPTATAGLWLGVATGLGGMAGGLSSGWLASRLSRRNASWLLRLPALTSVLAAPFIALFLSLPPTTALPSFCIAAACCGAVLGPVTTAAQEVAKVRMRATAAALLILTLNFVGTGLGPVAVGAVSDLLAPTLGDSSIRAGMWLAVAATLTASVCFRIGSRHLPADIVRSGRSVD